MFMKSKHNLKNKKGFTILEVLAAIAIMGIALTMSYNLLIMPTRIQNKVGAEAEIQNKMRLLNQTITGVIRDASATFALPRANHTNLTEGWNYIIPSMDISTTASTSIIEYKWDEVTQTHIARTIAAPITGVTYNLVVTKLTPSYADNLIEYRIIANIDGQTRSIQSEVEALNSLQVIDRGNSTNPSNTLAYRLDPRPTQVSDVQAAVTMVLDLSGSMLKSMSGATLTSYYEDENRANTNPNSRIYKLRVEAARLVNALSANANIYVSVVPFNNSANNAQPLLPARVNDTANAVLLDKVNNLRAEYGKGTNTADGMRRAYYILDDFSKSTTKKTNNFMIILVDGVTTFYSAYWARTDRYGNTTQVSYFDGNNQIAGELDYNSHLSNTTIGYYGGEGNQTTVWERNYVELIGGKIKNYGTGSTSAEEPIKVYVIGFSAVSADYGSLAHIASSSSDSDEYYTAGDSATLEAIFAGIQKDISDSLWHIGGPN